MTLIADVPAIVLNLPIALSLVAVTRYMLGFKTWKNYPVLALTLAYFLFYSLLDSTLFALVLWIIFTVLIIATAIGIRYLTRKLKLNHYARVAVMYLGATVVSLIALKIMAQTSYGVLTGELALGLGIFLIGTTIDELATLLFKKDIQEFARRTTTTISLSLIAGLLLTWGWWNRVLVNHQEILVIVLVIDAAAAFWTSIRLTEYIRFNSILKDQK